MPMTSSIWSLTRVGLGGGEVDLVEDGDDLVAGVDRLVDVGEGLGLDALGGVDDEERALDGAHRAGDLVGEVDVAGGVDEVEDVGPGRPCARVVEADGLGLDGDAALALDVHGVEELRLHLAVGDGAGRLDQAVGERRLAVVDVGDDGEVVAHLLLAGLLLVEELALAGDVAAVALGGDVLAQGRDGLAGDDAAADRGLDRDLEEVTGDQLLELLDHRPAAGLGAGAVDHHGEGVDRLVVDEDLHLDEVVLLVAGQLVVEGGVALGDGLQPVVEVEDHLVERQVVDDHGAGAGVGEVELDAAAVLAELEDVAEVVVGDEDRRLDPRLLDVVDAHRVGHVGGVVQLEQRAVGLVDVVDHRGRGGDEVEVELALEALADDLEVEEAEEAAAEAEAEGGGGLHLGGEGGVVELELLDGVAEVLEVGGVDGEEAAEDHRDRRA